MKFEIKADWNTTVVSRNKYSEQFVSWFKDKFTYQFPQIAQNFEIADDTDHEGPIFMINNNSTEELSTFDLLNLWEASKSEQRPKVYHDLPGVVDFYSGEVGKVEIDPDIFEAVRILNEKGYETRASCSGHYVDKPTEGYIWITNVSDLPSSALLKITKSENPGVSIRWKASSKLALKNRWEYLLDYVNKLPAVNLL